MTEKELYHAVLDHCYMDKDVLRRRAIATARARATQERGFHTMKKRVSIPLVAAALAGLLAVGAGAAFLLSPKEAAEKSGWAALESAFSSLNAITCETTQTDAGYEVTLLGAADGAALADAFDGLDPAQFYSVVAIANEDGAAMTEQDSAEFTLSPLIAGHNPMDYNVYTFGGGQGFKIINGILYQYVSCPSLAQYADDELYLALFQSSDLPNSELYALDDTTGVITANTGYEGLNALFTLPAEAFAGASEAPAIENRPTDVSAVDGAAALPAGEIDAAAFPEGIESIRCAGGPDLLVETPTRLCVYDTQAGTVRAELPLPQAYLDFQATLANNGAGLITGGVSYTVYPLETGFMTLLTTETDSTNGAMDALCSFYDASLQLQDTVTLNGAVTGSERFHVMSSASVRPSPSGKKIVFEAMFDGLFVYDRDSKALTQLLDYGYSEDEETETALETARQGISNITSMAFSPDESTLYFTAQTLSVPMRLGDSSFATAGSIRLDGTGLTNAPREDYPLDQFVQGGTTLLYRESHGYTSGRVLLQNTADATEHIWPLTTEDEDMDAVALSRDGKSFATGRMVSDGSSLTVRIYDSATGALVCQKVITPQDIGADAANATHYLASTLRICMLDDSRTCILQLGAGDAKIYSFTF